MQSQAENENQAMNQMVQDHAAKVAELDQTIADFQAQFSSQQNVITQFQQEYQKLVDGKKSSEEACESLKSQLKSAEVNYLNFNVIEKILTFGHQENFQLLQAECVKLQTLNGELGSQLHSNQNLESNVHGLTSQLSVLTEELNQLRWALGEKDLTLQSLSQQIQSYEEQNAQLKSSVHHLELSLNESNEQKQQLMTNFENNQVRILTQPSIIRILIKILPRHKCPICILKRVQKMQQPTTAFLSWKKLIRVCRQRWISRKPVLSTTLPSWWLKWSA
jgi:chromosome segregation ATPase